MFQDSSAIEFHVGKDLIVNGKNVITNIEKSIKNFNDKAWSAFGEDLGNIIGEVLSPEAAPQTQGCWIFNSCCSRPSEPLDDKIQEAEMEKVELEMEMEEVEKVEEAEIL